MIFKEIKEIMLDTAMYFQKSIDFVKPVWVGVVTAVSYVIFPTDTYIPATMALLCTLALDIITKYISVAHLNGGLYNAIKTKKLTSESLWRGTRKKLVGVLVVLILCGLSYRISPFDAIPNVIQSICFTVLFLREGQSVVENLIDCGYDDLRWLLVFMKKKEKELIPDDEVDSNEEDKTNI
ncbi:hypothetical protein F4V43_02625 [Paenibacillus spiritus]|uniref:Holin n=1 Tax=Paenibacillus spiritus TaxID=2496557 RepID=A0A5J5GHC1_9BACL|nr:phage holin family protein [Paenibacillus spiritus]KAA9007400.1 hypothetical protein F4V43_02625 [Paenibacillus spiritus]